MPRISFLFGSGFGFDAYSESGIKTDVRYPLVKDLLKPCFDSENLPNGLSIEQLFQREMEKGNMEPVAEMCKIIARADWALTPGLIKGGGNENNIYLKLFRDFDDAGILTFNNDSLPELILLSLDEWRPEDGYGVKVEAEVYPERVRSKLPQSSKRPVLHLHGSFCVYEIDLKIVSDRRGGVPLLQEMETQYFFDPSYEGHCFGHYRSSRNIFNSHKLEGRIIAPIPSKAAWLKGEFITSVYKAAMQTLQNTTEAMLAIGYSFNEADSDSYKPLLSQMAGKKVVVVCPEAGEIIKRLVPQYPNIKESLIN